MIQAGVAKGQLFRPTIHARGALGQALCCSVCGGLGLRPRASTPTSAASFSQLPASNQAASRPQVGVKLSTKDSDSRLKHTEAKLQAESELEQPKLGLIDTSAAFDGDAFQLPPYLAVTILPPSEDPQLRTWLYRQRNMTSRVEVISAPTADTPASLVLLHFDSTRYLFGQISEGTQRVMTQRRIPMSKINTLFMTGQTRWSNNGGLLGLVLTLAGVVGTQTATAQESIESRKARGLAVNKKDEKAAMDKIFHIFGPENFTHMLATARRFIFRQSMKLRPHEIHGDPSAGRPLDRDPDYKDENVRVWYMPIWPDANEEPVPEHGAGPGPFSPKKRTHDEMSGEEDGNNPDLDSIRQEEKYKFVREVVSQMFESDWSMDEVVKTTLHKARLPAKLFVKDEKGLLVKYDGPMPTDNLEVPDMDVYIRQPWPGARITRLPPTKPSPQSLCYIVRTHPRRGKFNPAVAQEHGVPRRDFGKLTSGESVRGADGFLVTPDMVLGEPLPARGFAVVDVPDASYIDSLLGRPEMASDAVIDQLAAIYWFLGPGVVTNPRIESYIRSHTKPKHIISAADVVPNYLVLESSAQMGIWLKMLDNKRFGDLHFNDIPGVPSLPGTSSASMPGRAVQLSPKLLFDYRDVKTLDKKKVVQSCYQKALDLAREADKIVADPDFKLRVKEAEADIPNRNAELITLGTGSAMPSKYRNVSATLLRVPGVGNYLFDCGENTLGQMRRCLGPELPDVLRNLKFIWISHLHADHHLGTTSVIRAWHEETSRSAPDATLDVASHSQMDLFLEEYSYVEDFGYASGKKAGRVKFHSLVRPDSRGKACVPVVFPEEGGDPRTGLSRIDAVFVDHCFGALAVCVTFPSGLKVAYSGDCRPSSEFADIARDATLLIHEATFSDEFRAEALAKKHCTITQAMEISRKMRARRVMLTHFSQRYPKIARIDDGSHAEVKDQAVLFGFDLMKVKLGEWREAQQYWPAIKELISEDEQKISREGEGEGVRAEAPSKGKGETYEKRVEGG